MAGCREHGIGAITVPSLEEVSSEVAVALHVSDHGLDGRSSLEFALDHAMNAALLA